MPDETVCPFFKEKTYKNNIAVGIICEGAEIWFAGKDIRRGFVYPLCGSVGNFKNCVLYKYLAKAADKE